MSIHEGGSGAPKHFLWGVIFFIIVVVITLAVFGYKHKVTTQNNNAKEQISDLQKTLSTLRKDKDVQTYELYDKSRQELEKLSYTSQIPTFYNEVTRLRRLYNFEFSNFSYSKWTIKVTGLAKSDSTEEWYKKFRSLITDFYDARFTDDDIDEDGNVTQAKLKSIFDLEFVKSFQWPNNVSTLLEFTIKPEEKEPEPEVEKQEENTAEQTEIKSDSQEAENALIEAAITQ